MDKPTVFFSHSSKDKDSLYKLKMRFCEITCGTIKVFMSSDGQSIPFGSNWVHKIDEGLKTAKIMYVFVTPNSISSSWIYFEAGYAYSKGIKVIPVGLGMDITLLKAPLNLLQGFNVTTSDGLNNIIATINEEFELEFPESFCDDDYESVCCGGNQNQDVNLHEYFSAIEFSVRSKYSDENDAIRTNDVVEIFNRYCSSLDSLGQNYSCDMRNSEFKVALVSGVRFGLSVYGNDDKRIEVKISPYNFEKSFLVAADFLSKHIDRECHYLHFVPKEEYEFMTDVTSVFSIICELSDIFKVETNHVGRYWYKSVSFSIFNVSTYTGTRNAKWVLSIVFSVVKTSACEIVELVNSLKEYGILRKKQQS